MSLIFLSHIHEERELALIFKEAIEEEFSGFVSIFVSSDGVTIPAGTNFLRRIEEGLTTCIAGIYLISPKSVNRNWINFELGALWVRNKINENNGQPEIPTLPVCHSGMTLGSLPQPITNLNSIQGGVASQLEFAFRSIQTAVGGRGKLRTDFVALAAKVTDFERRYTLFSNFKKLFQAISQNGEPVQIFDFIQTNTDIKTLDIDLGNINNDIINTLKQLEANELNGLIRVTTTNPGIFFQSTSSFNGARTVLVLLNVSVIRDHRSEIIG